MKDYYFGKNKDFILNYEPRNSIIVVNLPGKKQKIIPYSYANEIALLKQMRVQLRDNKYLNKVKKAKKLAVMTTMFCTLISVILASLIVGLGLPFEICSIAYTILAINVGVAVKEGYNTFKFKEIIDDIKKNNLFIENEEMLNANRKSDNIRDSITLNDIHDLSYKRVKHMVNRQIYGSTPKKRVLKKQ